MMLTNDTALLRVTGIDSGYGSVSVVHDISLSVHEGEICVLVGANGAGKSTLLGTISGLIKPTSGSITFAGTDITKAGPEQAVGLGLVHVPEGRRIFRGMTVRENLGLGLWRTRLTPVERRKRLDWTLSLFPFLGDRLAAQAEVLSGGEQQMLVIGQALMRKPRILLLDEPSLGLAPVMIERVFSTIERLRDTGLTVLLVEQVVERALELADRGFVMQTGRIVASGSSTELATGPQLRRAYLGASAVGIDTEKEL